jgi:hypothetical protein
MPRQLHLVELLLFRNPGVALGREFIQITTREVIMVGTTGATVTVSSGFGGGWLYNRISMGS